MYIDNDKEKSYIEAARKYLSEYTVFRKLLEMNEYEKKYFGKSEKTVDIEGKRYLLPGSEGEIRMKMFEIRRFVLSLGNCNEKLLLFYHYVHGESVERCAELMKISRRSAFRLKRRALAFAGRKLERYFEEMKNGVR
jgi:hypothetical protein